MGVALVDGLSELILSSFAENIPENLLPVHDA